MQRDSTPPVGPPDEESNREPDRLDVSRRTFLKGAGLTIAAVGVTGSQAIGSATVVADETVIVGPDKTTIDFTLNGKSTQIETEPWQTLLDTLRNEQGLTGAKRVCDRGACGACTVIVDGLAVNACSMLAIDVAGKKVTTVEGLATGDQLTPLQQAFVECDALQCGFCTPGMVVSCTALLEKNPSPSRDEIKKEIAGNLCRCGTYQNVCEAVEKAAKATKGAPGANF